MKIQRKRIIIIAIVLIIAVLAVYFIFLKKKTPDYSVEKVVRGSVVQEVSETGTIKKGEEINLNFKNSGRIEKIYVKVGDEIASGQDLAKLDTSQLLIQLAEAKASLELAKAQKGDAQISLDSAERNLASVKQKAEEDLSNAYEDAINTLNDAYSKTDNAFNSVNNVQKTYFSTPNEYGLKVGDEKYRIEDALGKISVLVNNLKSDPQQGDVDSALSEAKTLLEKTRNAIKGVRDITENAIYREFVSSTDKTSLDTQKTNIITEIDSITSAQQAIATTKSTNETNINNAETEFATLESQLRAGGNGGLYQAQVSQVQAQVALLEKQIQDATLQSPTDGKIARVEKREGETLQLTESFISLLPAAPFQIDVDIYEEDIVKIQTGNPVDIEIAAFPDKAFKGKVILIDPAEKLVSDVVYYEVKIDFENPPQGIKSGMTADITIKTAQKNNVISIPDGALKKKYNKEYVEILVNGKKIEEREIKIGLEGSDGMVEVISGLKEGEQVVIR